MATLEFYKTRLASKLSNLEKLNAKLNRIEKAKESGWTINPYSYGEYDYNSTIKDIELVKHEIEVLQLDIIKSEAIENSRNVKEILNWLENRKAVLREWYAKELSNAYLMKTEMSDIRGKMRCVQMFGTEYNNLNITYQEKHKIWYENVNGKFRDLTDEEKQMPKYRYTHHIKISTGKWEYISMYLGFDTIEEAQEQIEKDLIKWANGIYDDLIRRVNKVVGEITDASNLTINEKGGIDGIIKGIKCDANVHTISAEGDVQCFHYRTLVKTIKSRKNNG